MQKARWVQSAVVRLSLGLVTPMPGRMEEKERGHLELLTSSHSESLESDYLTAGSSSVVVLF